MKIYLERMINSLCLYMLIFHNKERCGFRAINGIFTALYTILCFFTMFVHIGNF